MQDIIEGDDIPLRRLIVAALRASAMLMVVLLMPCGACRDDSF